MTRSVVLDAHVNLRMPSSLLQALKDRADALGVTFSALARGVFEDAIDSSELPTLPPTSQDELDLELERLRELSRD